jgi:hypothetical protein
VYELTESWSRVTDGLKLIIVTELAAVYSFEDALNKLMLTDEEHSEVVDLFERELTRQAEEDAKIARSQARQLKILMSGGPVTSREVFSASFDDLYTDLDDYPMFIINKTDIAHAQGFLRSVKLREYADRLWRYEGVAPPPIVWNVSGSTSNESSNATECTVLEDEQQVLQTLENAEIGVENGEKRKSKALLRKVEKLLSGARPVKRRRVDPGHTSLKLPSGLRNSISADNLEENVAIGPPAMQAAFSPHRQPAPPPPRRLMKEKKPEVLGVKFANSPATPPTLQTPPRQVYNPLEHTPDSATARRQTQSWLIDQVEPYTPLPPSEKTPSPLNTPSRTPKALLTHSQARLAQIENILGKKTDAVAEPITPDRGHTIQIAPPMEASPEILPEKTRSALRHADAKLTAVSGRIESGKRDATGPTHKLGSEAYKQPTPTAHANEGSVAAGPRPKKRKIQGQVDSAYRASGQRIPKIQVQDKNSYKASGPKRQKIEVR